ncbi:MAG: hypothetical protein IT285_04310, partial [Bdellovibrionales bacterium]|nr:hypothetical protein [Bdellovibrionales bacterium]
MRIQIRQRAALGICTIIALAGGLLPARPASSAVVSSLTQSVIGIGSIVGATQDTDAVYSQPKYELQVSPAEARATLTQVLRNIQLRLRQGERPDARTLGAVSRLLRSYRSSSFWEPMPIHDGPFPGLIIQDKSPEVWQALYDEQWAANYEDQVVRVKLETLFDAFISLYLENQLPTPEMQAVGDKIGKCLARKIMRAKNTARYGECPLDASDTIRNVSTIQQLWAKTTCGLDSPPPCFARKTIYDTAKPELIKFRTDPAVLKLAEGEFFKEFPKLFRTEFLDGAEGMSARMRGFSQLINSKFRARFNPVLWGPTTALVEGLEDPREP